MQAAIQKKYGTPEVLELREIEAPVVADDQVLVRVHASAVTQGDRRLRAADYPGPLVLAGRLFSGLLRPRNPIPGTMFAGRVVAVGANVTRYAVGDDVFGSANHGAYAELLAQPEDAQMAHIPEGVSYEEAAAAPYGAYTALYFLRDLGQVQPGDRVAILGAAGGVGRYAVQLAKHFGAEVTAVCRAEQFDQVRDLGADRVLDYRAEDFAERGETYDLVLDTADATDFGHARRALSRTGRFLTLFMSLRILRQMLMNRFRGGQRALLGVAMGNHDTMKQVAGLLACGAIRPVIEQRFPFARIVDAHRAIEARPRGDLVVHLAG